MKLSGIVSPQGQIAIFNDRGEQVADLQESLLVLWARRATELGHDVGGVILQTSIGKVRIIKQPDGTFNWEEA